MRIALGSDHAGFQLKERLRGYLAELGHHVVDVGPRNAEPSDYPDFAKRVGLEVARGRARRGVMICGSGIGASIAANKIPGVRAALCHDLFTARQSVRDDDSNVLCLGSRVLEAPLALRIVKTWLSERFSRAARHRRRVSKVLAIERRFCRPRRA